MENAKQITKYIKEADENINSDNQKSDYAKNLDAFSEKIGELIDRYTQRLKVSLLKPDAKPQGFFNTLKHWWNNAWHGPRDKVNNPYYYQNIVGQLGRPDDSKNIPLEHYKTIMEYGKIIEEATNDESIPKLRLGSIIDNWAGQFKHALSTLTKNCLAGHSCSIDAAMSNTAAAAPAPVVPQATVAPENTGKLNQGEKIGYRRPSKGEPFQDEELGYVLLKDPAKKIASKALQKIIKKIVPEQEKVIENLFTGVNLDHEEAVQFVKKFIQLKNIPYDNKIEMQKLKKYLNAKIIPDLNNKKNQYKLLDQELMHELLHDFPNIKAPSVYIESLSEHKDHIKIDLEKEDTLYEKTIVCLEKLRS